VEAIEFGLTPGRNPTGGSLRPSGDLPSDPGFDAGPTPITYLRRAPVALVPAKLLGALEFLDRVGHDDLGRLAPPDRERPGHPEEGDHEHQAGPNIDRRPRLGRGGGVREFVLQPAQLARQAPPLGLARVQLRLEILPGTLGLPELVTQTEDAAVQP